MNEVKFKSNKKELEALDERVTALEEGGGGGGNGALVLYASPNKDDYTRAEAESIIGQIPPTPGSYELLLILHKRLYTDPDLQTLFTDLEQLYVRQVVIIGVSDNEPSESYGYQIYTDNNVSVSLTTSTSDPDPQNWHLRQFRIEGSDSNYGYEAYYSPIQ